MKILTCAYCKWWDSLFRKDENGDFIGYCKKYAPDNSPSAYGTWPRINAGTKICGAFEAHNDITTILETNQNLFLEKQKALKEINKLQKKIKKLENILGIKTKTFIPETIEDLGLPIRTENCLDSKRVTTVKELCSLSQKELLQIRGFGKTCLRITKDRLSDLGLKLKDEI